MTTVYALLLIITQIIIISTCLSSNRHPLRQLLDDSNLTSTDVSTTEPYEMDCCERTTGLQYPSLDCYDQNTPIILNAVEDYLMEPTNHCNNKTNCGYPSSSSSSSKISTNNLCLISWALYQQYYNQCKQIIITSNSQTSSSLNSDDDDDEDDDDDDDDESIDYSNAPKLI
eukprot:211233_1